MKLLIKIPTRSRFQQFVAAFMKYKYMLSGKHTVNYLVSLDEDDTVMNSDGARKFMDYHGIKYFYGTSKGKIEAINADMDKAPEYDVLILGSDDMHPIVRDYDDIIVTEIGDCSKEVVLHYNDGRQNERLNTMPIMTKAYYDRFGYIYNPEYVSVYCDNEFTLLSRQLGVAKYIPRSLFHHGWIETNGIDALYQRNESPEYYKKDAETFKRRAETNFGM
jgi:hypothetical protein